MAGTLAWQEVQNVQAAVSPNFVNTRKKKLIKKKSQMDKKSASTYIEALFYYKYDSIAVTNSSFVIGIPIILL